MRAAADFGGTFTDVLLQLPDGEIAYRKVLSCPPDFDAAVVDGVAELLGDGSLEELVHGTTVATNAVLKRRGARTALVTTKGFRDTCSSCGACACRTSTTSSGRSRRRSSSAGCGSRSTSA
jgi:N-methylhydantoinase A/oxoprolinase/acetone carboxylase beta subunit